MYVNAHIHSPFSFSSFDSIEQAVRLAKEENVVALGISDFNTIDGFEPFAEACERYAIYPLFNIEFPSLLEDDREKMIRWNDIANPGVMYLCGKALKFPISLTVDSKNVLASMWKGSQDRIWKMLSIINEYMKSLSLDILLDYHQIRSSYAKQSVRERHIAKALYMSFVERWDDPNMLLQKFRDLFKENSFNSDLSDSVTMQNEIRNRLFKPGKVAYVEENQNIWIRYHEARNLILDNGGIPCYPFFLDKSCEFTEMEKNIVEIANKLSEMEIFAVEFISNRVSFEVLKKYVRYFYERGFCITFGTEHCTPERYSLVPHAFGGCSFDSELEKIAFEGACIYAAHQELHRQNRSGYIDETGKRLIPSNRIRDFLRLGEDSIRKVTHR